ncbi:MAG: hypothetical protein RSC43_00870 [Clostridia bacterium]
MSLQVIDELLQKLVTCNFDLEYLNAADFKGISSLQIKDLIQFPQVGGECSRLAHTVANMEDVSQFSVALSVLYDMNKRENMQALICVLAYYGFERLVRGNAFNSAECLNARMFIGVLNTPKKGITLLV